MVLFIIIDLSRIRVLVLDVCLCVEEEGSSLGPEERSDLKSVASCSEGFAEMEGWSEELGDLKNGRDF